MKMINEKIEKAKRYYSDRWDNRKDVINSIVRNRVNILLSLFKKHGKMYNHLANKRPNVYDFTKLSRGSFDLLFRNGQEWGLIHPKIPDMWYAPSAWNLSENGLELANIKCPSEVAFYDGNVHYPAIGTGLVSSKQTFGYGFYEIDCEMPRGEFLWNAFWFAGGTDNNIAEIDIFEGVSHEKSTKYSDISSTIHYGTDYENGHHQVGIGKSKLVIRDKNKIICKVRYQLDFTKKHIRIYYNGYLVQECTNKNVLKHFIDQPLQLVLNNSINIAYRKSLFVDTLISTQLYPFVVKNFKYIEYGS